MDKIIETLKSLIDKNGPSYLTDSPYETYEHLIQAKAADRKTAGIILHVLTSDAKIDNQQDEATLSKEIQQTCCLNKKASDQAACIFSSLYCQENEEEWKQKDKRGLSEFLAEELAMQWDGEAFWRANGGHVDCRFDADIVVKTLPEFKLDEPLRLELEKNPFLSKDEIQQYYVDALCEYLDREFEEYCTCDDYYQPVVEDFEVEYYAKEWCKKNGFELVACDGDGDDGGFEPDFRRGWY